MDVCLFCLGFDNWGINSNRTFLSSFLLLAASIPCRCGLGTRVPHRYVEWVAITCPARRRKGTKRETDATWYSLSSFVSIGALFDLLSAELLFFLLPSFSFRIAATILTSLLDETLQSVSVWRCAQQREEGPARLRLVCRTTTTRCVTWVGSKGVPPIPDGPPLMKRPDVLESPSSNKSPIHQQEGNKKKVSQLPSFNSFFYFCNGNAHSLDWWVGWM